MAAANMARVVKPHRKWLDQELRMRMGRVNVCMVSVFL